MVKLPDIAAVNVAELGKLRRSQFRRNVYVNYNLNDDGTALVQFSTNDTSKPVHVDHFNGLIAEYPSKRVIVMPERIALAAPEDYCEMQALVEGRHFSVNKIVDGTIINLYHYGGEWVMSSTRGIKVNDNLCGSMTFQQMFDEALQAAGTSYSELVAQLRTDRSYSFGFVHPNMHHLFKGYPSWWLESPVPANAPAILRDAPKLPVVRETISHLYASCREATPADELYGYMISVKGVGRYLLKSRTLLQIQRFIHDRNLWKSVDGKDRDTWFAINAFVRGEEEAYRELFPEKAELASKFAAFKEYVFVSNDQLLQHLAKEISESGDVRAVLTDPQSAGYVYELYMRWANQ